MKRNLLFLYLIPLLSVSADELPKAAEGFAWHEFSDECVALQVPSGWLWREKDNHPAQTLCISPQFTENGGYDSGFTLDAIVCRNGKEWKDAYFSALQLWLKETKDIKALGKPTYENQIQRKDKAQHISMQVFIVEGDLYLPNSPHPKEKYRVRTIVRTIPPAGLIYVYSIGALVPDWEKIWKIGSTMIEPIVIRVPAKAAASHSPELTSPSVTAPAN